MPESDKAILAAEVDPMDAARLFRTLVLLGYRVRPASSAEQVMEAIRRQIFTHAALAIEMTIEGEPIITRLSALPSMAQLIAVGPPGDQKAERQARLAGADLYICRPVGIEVLAKALRAAAARTPVLPPW